MRPVRSGHLPGEGREQDSAGLPLPVAVLPPFIVRDARGELLGMFAALEDAFEWQREHPHAFAVIRDRTLLAYRTRDGESWDDAERRCRRDLAEWIGDETKEMTDE